MVYMHRMIFSANLSSFKQQNHLFIIIMLLTSIVNKNMKSLTTVLKRYVRIESMKTPNPNFLKFVPIGHQVLGDTGTLDIPSRQYSTISPLAQLLFGVEGVTRIFYGSDYFSVAKKQQIDWDNLTPEIYRIASDYFDSKKPILVEQAILQSDDIDINDSQTVQFIKEIIANRIRPNVQQDGGDVKFISFNQSSGVLTIKMVGACSGCPSSSATLKGGIQKMLTYYVKQVKEVVTEQNCSK